MIFVDWKDEDIDMNLVDAYLLNVTRIGHGFAINKHPLVRQLLETRRIPLEICPISNQVSNMFLFSCLICLSVLCFILRQCSVLV